MENVTLELAVQHNKKQDSYKINVEILNKMDKDELEARIVRSLKSLQDLLKEDSCKQLFTKQHIDILDIHSDANQLIVILRDLWTSKPYRGNLGTLTGLNKINDLGRNYYINEIIETIETIINNQTLLDKLPDGSKYKQQESNSNEQQESNSKNSFDAYFKSFLPKSEEEKPQLAEQEIDEFRAKREKAIKMLVSNKGSALNIGSQTKNANNIGMYTAASLGLGPLYYGIHKAYKSFAISDGTAYFNLLVAINYIKSKCNKPESRSWFGGKTRKTRKTKKQNKRKKHKKTKTLKH
jgi:hypothetical protein